MGSLDQSPQRIGIVCDVLEFIESLQVLASQYHREGFVVIAEKDLSFASKQEFHPSSVTIAIRRVQEGVDIMLMRLGIVMSGGEGESPDLPCEAIPEFQHVINDLRRSFGRIAEITGIGSEVNSSTAVFRLMQYAYACIHALGVPVAVWACSDDHASRYQALMRTLEHKARVPEYGGIQREANLMALPIKESRGERVAVSAHMTDEGQRSILAAYPSRAQWAMSETDRDSFLYSAQLAKEARGSSVPG